MFASRRLAVMIVTTARCHLLRSDLFGFFRSTARALVGAQNDTKWLAYSHFRYVCAILGTYKVLALMALGYQGRTEKREEY